MLRLRLAIVRSYVLSFFLVIFDMRFLLVMLPPVWFYWIYTIITHILVFTIVYAMQGQVDVDSYGTAHSAEG
jgi:hypothetical protein